MTLPTAAKIIAYTSLVLAIFFGILGNAAAHQGILKEGADRTEFVLPLFISAFGAMKFRLDFQEAAPWNTPEKTKADGILLLSGAFLLWGLIELGEFWWPIVTR